MWPLGWWLFCISIACVLLYITSYCHVHLCISAYVCIYLFYITVCFMITIFLHDACLVIMFAWDIDILITLIDSLAYLSILTLFIVWLSYLSWHMYSHCCISSSSWYVDFLCCILSWLFFSMLFISLILFLLSLCVDMDDIPITWLLFFCLMHVLLVSVGNKSISLPLIPSLG